jgi:hypothetical protein
MAADTEPIEILLHLPLLAEDKVRERRGGRRRAAAAAATPSAQLAPGRKHRAAVKAISYGTGRASGARPQAAYGAARRRPPPRRRTCPTSSCPPRRRWAARAA